MPKTLILIHGRHYKPPQGDLKKLWLESIHHGIARDHSDKLQAFKSAKIEFVYYGDISNGFLSDLYDEAIPDDLADRKNCLRRLKTLNRNQFTKANYRNLPGYNPWMEALADLAAGPLSFFRLSEPIIEQVAPDLQEYWNDYGFGSKVRAVCTEAIIRSLKREGEVCVIAHSLGTLITFDVLWKLSHYGEYRGLPWNRQIDRWITLGSPLGDETVKRNLKGAGAKVEFRYPTNVRHWFNVAAEDDYIAHDQRINGDYRTMKRLNFVESIQDKRVYNLAVRNEKANPHNATGYLVHPYLAELVAEWL